jgi:hypothetical protein
VSNHRRQGHWELFGQPGHASDGQNKAGRRLLVQREVLHMGQFERSEDFQRAIQLKRWIESTPDTLPTRTRGMVLRSLSLITRPQPSSLRIPEEAPLAGLDPRGFIEQLHRPEGGAVAKVSGIGPATIEELRAALPPPGDPRIPSYAPPTPTASHSPLPSGDPVGLLLNELWACLGEQERLRLVELAVDLVIERARDQEAPELTEAKEIAEAVKRRIEEMRSAGGPHADTA